MKSLREVLTEASNAGVAVGHFNVADSVGLTGVFQAARELNVPVIIGLSEGERAFMGMRQAAAMVRSLREEYSFPVFLNADHTHSLASAEAAVRAGYDSVVFDRSSLPMEANIAETRAAVERLKAINPEVLVEGEIGEIGSGSEIRDRVPDGITLTTPEEARQFVAETGVDLLAPAVGNMHGLLRSMLQGNEHKRLRIDLIRQIREAAQVFLTLHGGSGTEDADFVAAIGAGITEIHINTEIRVAWRRGVEAGLARDANEVAPYKILAEATKAIREAVAGRLRLFQGLTREGA